MNHKIEYYKRKNGQWAWRFIAKNGQVVATDGNQGYESKAKVRRAIDKFLLYFTSSDVIEIVDASKK